MFAAPGFSGFAWRNSSTGTYTYQTAAVSLTTQGLPGKCVAAIPVTITTIPRSTGRQQARRSTSAERSRWSQLGGPPVGSILLPLPPGALRVQGSQPPVPGLPHHAERRAQPRRLPPIRQSGQGQFYVLNSDPGQSAVAGNVGHTRGLELSSTA